MRMNNTIPYKGYFGSVEASLPDNIFHGHVLGIRSILTYEGNTLEELIRDFQEVVDEYLEECLDEGRTPEIHTTELVSLELPIGTSEKIESAAKRMEMWPDEAMAQLLQPLL